MTLREKLFSKKDGKYRDFQSKIIPTVSKDKIIGVRTPDIRSISKTATTDEKSKFMCTLPHLYYEENNLHVAFINNMQCYNDCVKAIDSFLPYVDNWATCDMLLPPVLAKHKGLLIIKIREWISSSHEYTVRFGIGMLMKHFLDEDFSQEYPQIVSSISSEKYYVNTMIAWYFATALCKQYDVVIEYIKNRILTRENHMRTIQKAIDSYRISSERKKYLKSLRY